MTDTLKNMLTALELLEAEIDDSAEITQEMCDAHFQKMSDVQQKTDMLLAYIEFCKHNFEKFEERQKQFKIQSAKWKKRKESLENYGLYLLKRFPNLEFAGSDYQLTARNNPPSVVCLYKSDKSFSNYIPDAYTANIPPEYLEQVTVSLLKTDEVSKDLKAGMKLAFAEIMQKQRLVAKPKVKELNK